jgi:hypothetical protein
MARFVKLVAVVGIEPLTGVVSMIEAEATPDKNKLAARVRTVLRRFVIELGVSEPTAVRY